MNFPPATARAWSPACWVRPTAPPRISPDVNDPAFRNITFDQLRATYRDGARGLIKGGSDVLMIETVFDTLNCKAAIFAIEEVFAEMGVRLPVWISGTITDLSGRTLTGQTPEAFWHSVRHANPFAIGLNCALGAKELRPYIADLAAACDTLVSAPIPMPACPTNSAAMTRRRKPWRR